MKNSFNIETLETIRTLTLEEQNTFRIKFKPLLKIKGIKSLCLEAEELFVEFNPTEFNLDSFKIRLVEMGIPMKLEAIQV